MSRRTAFLVLTALAAAFSANAQVSVRHATNLAALLAYPDFFHLKPVLIVGTVKTNEKGDLEVSSGTSTILVVATHGAPDGLGEIRGEFWDIGRMKPDDPRLGGYDVRSTFHVDPGGPWPRPGDILAIVATAVTPASAALAPSIRAIVLNPDRYLDQRVTITGQYAGRNLNGELPDAPARSRFDFVLHSADAAIWVSNVPPRGKDFDLGLDAHVDTGRWLQVSGTVQHGRGLLWIDADAGTLALAEPTKETLAEDVPVALPPPPAPEVVFSTPTDGETDVSPNTTLRIQFSRELNPATLTGKVRVSYAGVGPGQSNAPPGNFTVQYVATTRVLELKFAKPLEPYRTVRVQLLEGITGRANQPVVPWTLTFTLGGP